MTNYVLDTNMVSLLIREDMNVKRRFTQILEDTRFLGCPIVWYELERGLKVRDAKKQMQRAEDIFANFEWQDYTRDDWTLASTLWSHRQKMGRPIEDADLMIAVFALNRNAVLVTDNVKDFDGLGVTLENWK